MNNLLNNNIIKNIINNINNTKNILSNHLKNINLSNYHNIESNKDLLDKNSVTNQPLFNSNTCGN